ncbi:pentatricopeptide repeat-containing protein At3g22150, chloroplastic-like [Tripterygium wilfordii]|uniref:pentatricopeptide repeat-containing protein At3g22150, chloroplastic-like n=1 Tax=Tripterygium wilfordii TaxID=458696 RepID=UPI0018F82C68|nr:pentatricopeptide repeat-containing protein At3g22150, chloroplastic-like [Tripterygium wilfordii]
MDSHTLHTNGLIQLHSQTTTTWNTIIGFIFNNLSDEALLLYSRMKNVFPRVKCHSYTCSSTLKPSAETRLVGRKSRGLPSYSLFNESE